MAIIMNIPCPECQANGHDQKGTNMMVFADGARLCNRQHWHSNGLPLYLPPNSNDPVLDMAIKGDIKYTTEQFRQLCKEGKLSSESLRMIALGGMKGQDRWEVSTDIEKAQMEQEKALDKEYYNLLKTKNLVSRHIRGDIAKFYGVKVGHDKNGKVDKHYYPIYDKDGEWKGAKCRMLPKDFKYGHLGWMWGSNLLFGQNTLTNVLDLGGRLNFLLLVGGECDAMAAQQMLRDSAKGDWKNIPFHVWSPTKGEMALKEILDNKSEINKFQKIILCFDNDDVGKKTTQLVAKQFRDKCFKLVLPGGCKDPNDCLKKGKDKEFVDAWWNPVSPFEGGIVVGAGKYRDKAKEMPIMGLSWPWPDLDSVTYGIRKHFLSVWGAGTGVGKTKTTKTIVDYLINIHKRPVVVIYLEEQPEHTLRSFAGELINKDLNAPPINDPGDPEYLPMRDYIKEEADAAIDSICDSGMLMIADLQGRKDADSVLEVCEEAFALGYEDFVIDNLTAFEHKNKENSTGIASVGSVTAIDYTMKRLGTFKDEYPVNMILLSHLKRPFGERKAHESGGAVNISDFRGSGSITFWADCVIGIERNTAAESMEERCLTCYHCIKNRTVGYKVGTKVYAELNFKTGKLEQTNKRPINSKEKDFDYGTANKSNKHQEDKEF